MASHWRFCSVLVSYLTFLSAAIINIRVISSLSLLFVPSTHSLFLSPYHPHLPVSLNRSYPNIGGFQSVSAKAAPGQAAADALVSLVSTMGIVHVCHSSRFWFFRLNISRSFRPFVS
jgi:hypothetical protein